MSIHKFIENGLFDVEGTLCPLEALLPLG